MRIFVSAGEASGDLHASHAVRAITKASPDVEIVGMGGPLLREAGVRLLIDYRDLSVVGIWEVTRHLKAIIRAWRSLVSSIKQTPPDVLVLVDFPDFNFILGRVAKRLGVKVFYYISPQVWAWRSGRVRAMRRFVDRMAVILPFEEAFYKKHQMQGVCFVGHPLLDVLREMPSEEDVKSKYRTNNGWPLIGLLPGSRRSELRELLTLMLDAATLLLRRFPEASFIIPVAASLSESDFEAELHRFDLPVRLVRGDTYGVMKACDLLLTVSGTATLEAAILGTPMIIVNRISSLSYLIGRHLIKVPWIGLPNLIAGKKIVPELLQRDARSDNLAAEAARFLLEPQEINRQKEELRQVAASLGEGGVASRVARLILETAGRI